MNVSSELPTFNTYVEIIDTLVQQFFSNCSVWAEPAWLENTISLFVVCTTIFYLYIFGTIIYNFRQLNNPFYLCTISLAIADLVIIIMSIREARVQSCVLGTSPARHLAWQTIGTIGLDGTLTNGLVLALTRYVTIFDLSRERLPWQVAGYGIVCCWLWTITMTLCSHFGLETKIWFVNGIYMDQFNYPFQYIRLFILFICVIGVLVIYLACFYRLIIQRHSLNYASHNQPSIFHREIRLFLQSTIIFMSQILFLYTTFWFGHNYLHIGSAEFNANLNYIARPVTTGLTPYLYTIFSSQIREMAFSRKKRLCNCCSTVTNNGNNAVAIAPVNGNTGCRALRNLHITTHT